MTDSGTRPPFTTARVPNKVPSLDLLFAADATRSFLFFLLGLGYGPIAYPRIGLSLGCSLDSASRPISNSVMIHGLLKVCQPGCERHDRPDL